LLEGGGYFLTAPIWTFDQISTKTLPPQGRVLVGGCFDLIHYGHLKFLNEAKILGDSLIVAVEPDEKIRQLKKRNPIHTVLQRAEILANLSVIDGVIILPYWSQYEEYLNLVIQLKPSYIAVTEYDPQLHYKKQQAEFIGAQLKIVTPNIGSFSSSKLITDFSL
jgi:FAD synthetase